MISLRLLGSPTCHRYQRMRQVVLDEAQRLGVAIRLEEINEAGRLASVNPLHLPQLRLGGEIVARGNPPSADAVARWLTES